MNPTPDGHMSKNGQRSRSTPAQIQKYRSKISGPLLDRIDIQVEADAITPQDLDTKASADNSATIRSRIEAARARQTLRSPDQPGKFNSALSGKDLDSMEVLNSKQKQLLHQAMERLQLSARAYDRIRKVSRTIADLAGSNKSKMPTYSSNPIPFA